MIKVLKHGNNNPEKWKIDCTCTGYGWNNPGKTPCSALLEIDQSSILKRHHTDISGETDVYYGFVCPVCGCFTEIESKNIPNFVKNNATEYKVPMENNL